MCGRFVQSSPVDEMQEIFGFPETPNLAPRYNIAPTTNIAAIRRGEEGGPHLFTARWGLIPAWAPAPDISTHMFNARSETVREKPAFRAAFESRRCLIPANGFYEWEKADSRTRQPWFIHVRGRPLIAFAGLWESWTSPEGEEIESCTILTVAAAMSIAFIHPRMPVILQEENYGRWLDGSAGEEILTALPDAEIARHRVSQRVGNVHQDDADLLAPAQALPTQTSLF